MLFTFDLEKKNLMNRDTQENKSKRHERRGSLLKRSSVQEEL